MRRVSPREAHELMVRDGYVYLDVRTETEFVEGHPRGAYNVPVALPGEHGLVPNPAFVAEVTARIARTTPVVVGCASGVRSLEAARQLVESGYGSVVEQRAGLNGLRDAFGRIQERGWRDEGLPMHYVGADEQERT
jgi:rhodanese-related sulfurtransferase